MSAKARPANCVIAAISSVVLLLAVALTPNAVADSRIGDPALDLQFANAVGSGSFQASVLDGQWDSTNQELSWVLPTAEVITDQNTGVPVAVLIDARYVVRLAPKAQVEMSISALLPDLTTITALSPSLSFAPIDNAGARSSVSFNLADSNGDGIAEMRAVGPPGEGAFKAFYNDQTVFSSLIHRISIESAEPNVPAGEINVVQNDPDFGFRSVPEPVSGVRAQVRCTLTEGDLLQVSGFMGLAQAVEAPCAGDVDADGFVDVDDLTDLLASFGACVQDARYNGFADLNDDGCVNINDLTALLAVFGTQCN